MRLDKYLKVSRIIKRRSVAKEISDSGRIKVNDKTAKSSTKLKVGDKISITSGNHTLVVKVLDLQASKKKEDASSLYEIIQEK